MTKLKIFRLILILVIIPSLVQQTGWAGCDLLRPRSFSEQQGDEKTETRQRKYVIKNLEGKDLVFLVDFPDAGGKRPGLFLFHGVSGFKTEPHLVAFARRFVEEGYVVIRPDFTDSRRIDVSFNESEGRLADFTLAGEVDDALRVIKYARDHFGDRIDFSRIIIGGNSFGGWGGRKISEVPLEGLCIRIVLDLSGVVSVPGTLKTILRDNIKITAAGGVNLDEAYDRWRREGKDYGFQYKGEPNQGFIASGMENYNAVENLGQLPLDTDYIYVIGAQDDRVMCTGLPEAAEYDAFISALRKRGDIILQYDNMTHGYNQELLPRIIDDVSRELRVLLSASPQTFAGTLSDPHETLSSV